MSMDDNELFLSFKSALTAVVPLQNNRIAEAFQTMKDNEKTELISYVRLWLDTGSSLDDLADAYKFIVDETNKEQLKYFRNIKGYCKNQVSVEETVYDDADYMKKYMVGLAISMFVWQQHIDLYQFFTEEIDHYNKAGHDVYLEIGAGHGLFGRYVVRNNCFDQYLFVDISPCGLELTSKCINAISDGNSIDYHNTDFLKYENDRKFSFICAGEVIEAVPDPKMFLEKCYDSMIKGGEMYLSTPINTAVPDTVTVFDSIDHVEKMIAESGFDIKRHIYISYNKTSLETSLQKHLPVNVGYILEKN